MDHRLFETQQVLVAKEYRVLLWAYAWTWTISANLHS